MKIDDSNTKKYYLYFQNPYKPINRSNFEKYVIFFFEFIVIFLVYIILNEIGGQFSSLGYYSSQPAELKNFAIQVWISYSLIIFLSHIFSTISTLCGVLLGELLIEISIVGNVNFVLLISLGWSVILQGWKKYSNGDFLEKSKIQNLMKIFIIQMIVILPILYLFYDFNYEFDSSITLSSARLLLVTIFFINSLASVIFAWLCLLLLDTKLKPYFLKPAINHVEINDSQKKTEINNHYNSDSNFDFTNGIVYKNILTHHSIQNCDHTIVVNIGQVKIFFCTRCTAMLLGAFLSYSFFHIIVKILDIEISNSWLFWLTIILPIFPIMDWGLQAFLIRKATTLSRLITGFIIGIAMNTFAMVEAQKGILGIIVLLYFGLFFLLNIFKKY